MASSPYAHVHAAATTLARRLRPMLNAARAVNGLALVPLLRVDRISTSAGDYGTLSAQARDLHMAANVLSFRRFPPARVRGAHLLVIDDVRVTGAHQRCLMRASAALPLAARTFLYIAAFPRQPSGCFDPAREDALNHTDYIVAVAHAGIPWAKTVAERLDLPLAYVRAGAREPGGPLVECEPGTADQAVVIEDVVASGASAARAIRALHAETSLRVAGVQSIANWNFPEMRELLAPWTVRAITSYPQVLASAREAGPLSGADVREFLRFYADPRRHRWPSGPAAEASLSEPFGCNTYFNL